MYHFRMSTSRKEDLNQKGLRQKLRKITDFYISYVGKKTSIRRDCDIPVRINKTMSIIGRKEDLNQKGLRLQFCKFCRLFVEQERRPQLEGIATEVNEQTTNRRDGVGKKTSIRRDCDPGPVMVTSLPSPQERRPQLEGIATSIHVRQRARASRRKEDLNQKGLRHDPSDNSYISQQERRPQLEGIATHFWRHLTPEVVEQERRPQLEGIATF